MIQLVSQHGGMKFNRCKMFVPRSAWHFSLELANRDSKLDNKLDPSNVVLGI